MIPLKTYLRLLIRLEFGINGVIKGCGVIGILKIDYFKRDPQKNLHLTRRLKY